MKASEIKAKRVPTDKNQVRVILGGRATYAFLMEAQQDDPDNPESNKSFKSGILIHKNCPAAVLTILRQAISDAVQIGIDKKWGGKKPMNLQLPLNDGDIKFAEDAEKYSAYKGMLTMTAKKLEKLGRPILKAHGKNVTEAGVIESGDWCAFDINFYPYANRAKGVAVALNAVTLIKEGERFGGGPSEQSIEEEASSLYSDIGAGDIFGSENSGAADDPLMGLLGGGGSSADDLLAGL